VPDDSRSRAKGGTRNAKAGARNAKAGARNAQAAARNAKAGTPGTKAGTQNAKAAAQNAPGSTRNPGSAARNARAGTQGTRPWFGPKGLGMGYRPQTWQGYLVMLVLAGYAIFIGTLSADHHSPLILLAIAPAALVPRLIGMIQQR
jgi:hypothetical protein